MVNPGAFRGVRYAFLVEQKPLYANAVTGGHVADCLSDIQRRYFKRFPVDSPHDVDPPVAFLESVRDDEADPEPTAPDEDSMLPQEYRAAVKEFRSRQALIAARKDQIKRWMGYQYNKDRSTPNGEVSVDDPMTIILAKLTGTSLSKPRQPIPYNLWAKEDVNRDAIDQQFKTQRVHLQTRKRELLTLRTKITKELYDKLPEETKREWRNHAKHAHNENLSDWKGILEGPPSTTPDDRQTCIEGLVGVVQPLLDLICQHSGMKATLLVGGPEPADGGRLNVISFHSGTTSGPVQSNFGQAERAAYKEYVIPLFSRFLQKCYTMEECRARALPSASSSVLAMLTDPSVTVHNVDLEPTASMPLVTPSQGSQHQPPAAVETTPTSPVPSPVRFPPPSPTSPPRSPPAMPPPSPPRASPPHSPSAVFPPPPLPATPHRPLPAGLLPPPLQTTPKRLLPAAPPPPSLPATLHRPLPAGLLPPPLQTTPQRLLLAAPPPPSLPATPHCPLPAGLLPPPSATPQCLLLATVPPPLPATPLHPLLAELPPPPPPATPKRRLPATVPSPLPATPLRSLPAGLLLPPPPAAPQRPPLALSPPPSQTMLSSYPLTAVPPPPPLLASPQHSQSMSPPPPLPPFSPLAVPQPPPSPTSSPGSTQPSFPPSTPPFPPSTPPFPTLITMLPSGLPDALVAFNAPTVVSLKKRSATDEEDGDGAAPAPKRRKSGAGHREAGGRATSKSTKRGGGRGPAGGPISAPPTASSINDGINETCSAWMETPLGMLRGEALGPSWDEVVRLWVAFEIRNRMSDPGRIGATKRPTCVADWIQRARAPGYRPKITNLTKFSNDYGSWWTAIQPDWRREEGSVAIRRSGNMTAINKPGINGLLSVLAALFFWGTALGGDREGDDAWKHAVEDLDWVLRELLASGVPAA